MNSSIFLYFLHITRYRSFDQDIVFEVFLLNEKIKTVIFVFCQLGWVKSLLNCLFSSTNLKSSVNISLLLGWISTEELCLLLFDRFFLCFFLYLFIFLVPQPLEPDKLLIEEVNEDFLLFFSTFLALLDFVSGSFLWLFGTCGGPADIFKFFSQSENLLSDASSILVTRWITKEDG